MVDPPRTWILTHSRPSCLISPRRSLPITQFVTAYPGTPSCCPYKILLRKHGQFTTTHQHSLSVPSMLAIGSGHGWLTSRLSYYFGLEAIRLTGRPNTLDEIVER